VFSGLLALGIFAATSARLGSRGHGTTKLGAQEDEQSVAAIRRALELGVNWIDTAAYGFVTPRRSSGARSTASPSVRTCSRRPRC
jgi:hypothetical protein